MEFVSIDVETANADMASLCQVGIACYDKNCLVDEWVTLVDPEDEFDFINILRKYPLSTSKIASKPC